MSKQIKSLVNQRFIPYIFLAPNLALFITFMFIPIIYTFYISLTQWSLIGVPKLIGFKNFNRLFHDPHFWAAILNTVYYTGTTVLISMTFGLLGAILLNRNLPFRGLLRTVFFAPAIASLVASGLIWQWLFSTDYGIINTLLNLIGIGPQRWLTSNALAMPSVIMATIWIRAGYCMVIYLAGLNNIAGEYYESAEIDGAKPIQKFKYITWPLLRPTTVFLLIVCIIYGFMAFDLLYVMTGGGPGFSTTVMVHYIYQQAFNVGEMGYAAAGAVTLFLLVLILTVIQLRGDKDR